MPTSRRDRAGHAQWSAEWLLLMTALGYGCHANGIVPRDGAADASGTVPLDAGWSLDGGPDATPSGVDGSSADARVPADASDHDAPATRDAAGPTTCTAVATVDCFGRNVFLDETSPREVDAHPQCSSGLATYTGPEDFISFTAPEDGTYELSAYWDDGSPWFAVYRSGPDGSCRLDTTCIPPFLLSSRSGSLEVDARAGEVLYVVVEASPDDALTFVRLAICQQ